MFDREAIRKIVKSMGRSDDDQEVMKLLVAGSRHAEQLEDFCKEDLGKEELHLPELVMAALGSGGAIVHVAYGMLADTLGEERARTWLQLYLTNIFASLKDVRGVNASFTLLFKDDEKSRMADS